MYLLVFSLVLMTSCTLLYREVRYYQADITDYKIFPSTPIAVSDKPFHFREGNENLLAERELTIGKDSNMVLNDILKQTSTTAFIVIRNDSVLFEDYYNGSSREQISTFFSVSKSVTSMLLGVAIDEGYIKSIQDPITKYIPELNDGDPLFKELTLEHLLNMRSGMKYSESYSNPFSDMAKLYYGTNQLGKLKRMKFEYQPGTIYDYQSSNTALLGIAIERATGKNLGSYLEEKAWKPLGMEYAATWSMDDKRHQSAKAYGGLNASAIDLAKIGRLYLNDGKFENQQVVSEKWVKKANDININNEGYQYQWWSFSGKGVKDGENYFTDSLRAVNVVEEVYKAKVPGYEIWKNNEAPDAEKQWRITVYTGAYYALGIMNQVLYIDPDKNLIMVRLGANGDKSYPDFMYLLSRYL